MIGCIDLSRADDIIADLMKWPEAFMWRWWSYQDESEAVKYVRIRVGACQIGPRVV